MHGPFYFQYPDWRRSRIPWGRDSKGEQTGMDAYMSIEEVSTLLNIKKPTLYQWVESGEIPHYKVNRLIRFKRDEVLLWMEGHRVAPVDVSKKVKEIMKNMNHPPKDVKKPLDGMKCRRYTSAHTENQPIAKRGGEDAL